MGYLNHPDNGTNWTAVNNGLPFDVSANEYPSILSLAVAGSTLYAGTAARFVRLC
ncbi:MAG: hypothetical protein IPF68_16460 [Bacteroidales bacterium]|nr:hypothetical protein [Bacteroidales bacterium]